MISSAKSSGLPFPSAFAAAPLVAPAHVGYAHAVPQNIPPYASQINLFSRALSPLVAGPFAAPIVAPGPFVAPGAPFVGPFNGPLSAPLVGPAPGFSSPYLNYPGAPYPLLRTPTGFASTFVR